MATHRNRDAAVGQVARDFSKSMPSLQSRVTNLHPNGGDSHQNHTRTLCRSSTNSHRLAKRPPSTPPVRQAGNLRLDCVGVSSGDGPMRQLLLLHLELIQQLQEQLKAKDVEITRLANERDQMAVRIERMERRIVLLRKKRSGDWMDVVPQVPKALKADCPDSDDCDILEKTDPFGSSRPQEVKHQPPIVNSEPEPDLWLPSRRFRSLKATAHLPTAVRTTEGHTSTASTLTSEDHDQARQSLSDPTSISVDSSNPSTPVSAPSTPGPSSPWMPPEAHGLREETPAAPVVRDVDCVHTRFVGALHEGTYKAHEIDEMDIRRASQDPDIKVPKWRMKAIHGQKTRTAYVEDIADNTYLKRHNKSEIEEKRIKRWDVRRIRQQRQQEALKRRYSDGMIQKGKLGRVDDEEPTHPTFLPNTDLLECLEVADDVAVSAFGQPVPLLKEREFELPWFTVRSRNTAIRNTRTKSKLKSRLFHRVT